jgi:hypothetical protein
MGNGKVVLFEEDEKSLNYMFEKYSNKLKSTDILSIEYDKEKFLSDYEIVGQEPEIGSVYYKHPSRANCYVDSSLDEYYFMQEKIVAYSKVVQLLGATSIEAKFVLDSVDKMEFGADGDIKYQSVDFNSAYNEVETNKITQKLILKDNYEIQPNYDVQTSYTEASLFIASQNFSSDPILKGFLDSRNPISGSLLKRQIVKTELTSDYNKLLEFSAGLNVMGGVFNLNMSFSKKFESIKKVYLEMTIHF